MPRKFSRNSHVIIFIIVAPLALAIAIAVIGFRMEFGLYNPLFVVSSGSMLPTLRINDIVIVGNIGGNSFTNLKVGDIILFNVPSTRFSNGTILFGTPGGTVNLAVVHRIAQILIITKYNYNIGKGEEKIIRTKGDANPSSIPGLDYPIHEQNYIGKVVNVIPTLGVFARIIRPPINYIVIAIFTAILFFYLYKKGS